MYSIPRKCSRSDKHRKGHLISIDNGQLASNEKMGPINRGRGSYVYNAQTRLYTLRYASKLMMYHYMYTGRPVGRSVRQ